MTTRASRPLLLLALAALGAATGSCRDSSTKSTGCDVDADCASPGTPVSAWRCEATTGACSCRVNDACDARQFCNTAGFCQDRTGCEKNADCIDPNQFCDTATGTCLTRGRCASDLHCALGQVCDRARQTCVEGCRTHGDCQGTSCRCGDGPCTCTGSTPEEISRCQVGVCDPGFCADESFCQFGELCGQPPGSPATGGLNQCFSDADPDRRPYCDNCVGGGGVATCGGGPNYCLIDTVNRGNYFCGADCSRGQACPRGYACQDVIIVFQDKACSPQSSACPTSPNMPCAVDADCKRGGTCINGFCAGKCAVDEGDTFGFCSCLEDGDCVQNQCVQGECSISKHACVDQVASSDCPKVHCVDFQGAGGCFIGQNCAPANGLSCVQVR